MASRAVTKESSKWRSCLALERIASTRPSARGGKMPQALAKDECIAAENDGDVVIPAAKGATFVVVQSELALEIFIYALGSPSLLGDPYKLLSTPRLVRPGQRVVRGRLLVGRPFDQEPVEATVGVARIHLQHGESRAQRATTSLLP